MAKLRLVRKEGGSRVLSMSEIPPDWEAVEVVVTKKPTDKSMTVKINRIK